MRVKRKIRTMALMGAAGAAAAYYLDPDNGPERRRRAASVLDEARRSLEERAERLAGEAPDRSEDSTVADVAGPDGSVAEALRSAVTAPG
jgi:hypothetical protein